MRQVIIMGRPNCGKSTLFNRLLGRREALVHPRAGVTRDRKVARVSLSEKREILLVDTGGLFPDEPDDFSQEIEDQAREAILGADLVLLLLDASQVSPLDHEFAGLVRRSGKPVMVVANKIDRIRGGEIPPEVYELGFDSAIGISAEHGTNCSRLRSALDQALADLPLEGGSRQAPKEDLAFVLIGRPNVGKSSLLNSLLKKERAIVSPIAGTTRDSIDDWFDYQGRTLRVIDTAGLRRKARVREDLEYYSTLRAERSIHEADLAVLLLEPETLLTEQDKKIIGIVESAGKGLIFAINKWDSLENKTPKLFAQLEDRIRFLLPEFSWVPVVAVSAKTGRGLKPLLEKIIEVQKNTRRRLETPELNRFVSDQIKAHLPSKQGRQLKIYYAVQTGTLPPYFTFFVNNAKLATTQYNQYLRNTLRKHHQFEGTPIWIRLRDKKEAE